jgi:FtsZ-interacting cell division protein ZipA
VISEREGAAATGGAIEALTLLLDVPRVPDVGKVYESMVRCAGHLATVLGGEIVDDNGRALDERALTAIEAELVKISRALESRGITPGGQTALRLFS